MITQRVELIPFRSAEDLANAAAMAWLDKIERIRHPGREFCVALSGGRIAQKFFSLAARHALDRAVAFDRVHFFWADERCVPPGHAESNYRIALELLLVPLRIPEPQIHRIHGEELWQGAGRAEAEIRELAGSNGCGQPVFDLILLGMGEDGHVASLFPGEPEKMRLNPAVYRFIENSPKPPPNRVTLGYPAIAAGREVWVLISGSGKQRALNASLESDGQTPLAQVIRTRHNTRIYSDIH